MYIQCSIKASTCIFFFFVQEDEKKIDRENVPKIDLTTAGLH